MSGKDGDGWRSVDESAGLDGSAPVRVNVEPGTGEGGTVEITRVVTVNVGSSVRLKGNSVGESELVSRGWEGEGETRESEDGVMVGGKDDLGSMVNELGVYEGGDVGGRVEGGRDVRDVGGGVKTVTLVDVDVGIIVSLVEE